MFHNTQQQNFKKASSLSQVRVLEYPKAALKILADDMYVSVMYCKFSSS